MPETAGTDAESRSQPRDRHARAPSSALYGHSRNPPAQVDFMQNLVRAPLVSLVFLLAPALAGCSDSQKQGTAGPPLPTVTVATPVQRTIVDQVVEQRAQAKRHAEALVSWNEKAVQQAELDVEFTELKAAVSGRIGDRRVTPGNLVTGGTAGNTTLLATIMSRDPIRFEFTFDEASYLRYERFSSG